MAQLRTPSRSPVAVRKVGYLVGVLVNVVLLGLVHVWPGWDAVPFLTADMESVLGLVTAALVAGAVFNAVYLLRDPRWLVAAGGLVGSAIGLAALVRMLQVFPFAFDAEGFDWDVVVRVGLVAGVVGGAIGVLVNLVTLVREVSRGA